MDYDDQQLIAAFGTAEPLPESQMVVAGDFVIRISGGQIKSVLWRDREIARSITYFLRDADWATPLPLTSVTMGTEADAETAATITGEVDNGPIRFSYEMSIRVDVKGTLSVKTKGRALSDFRANRVGLTILHPVPDCAGAALRVGHTDSREEVTRFPVLISPSQPVFDIRSLTYSLSDSEEVEIGFSSVRPDGSPQAFEMEDQRNWGDASYKTYVGSLRDPWPFAVTAGDEFAQEITITVRPNSSPAALVAGIISQCPGDAFKLPEIGISVPLGVAREALNNVRSFGCFRPSYLLAYLRTDAIEEDELQALAQLVNMLDCPLALELEVHGDPYAALEATAAMLDRAGLHIASVLACPAPYLLSYQPDGKWPDVMDLADFYRLARKTFPDSRIGGGMLSYFTELNRKWPPVGAIDYVAHAYCPIIHAADDETVIQNIDTLPFIARTISDRLPGMPYEILSASISMRLNPYGAAPMGNPNRRRIAMAISDPREKSQFGALWMLEVTEVLARADVRAIALGALAGNASIYDPGAADGRLPTYHALKLLSECGNADEALFVAMKDALIAERLSLAREMFDGIRPVKS